VIDAEQTLEDNVIKVNKIQKKFIGYDSQEVSEFVRMKKFTQKEQASDQNDPFGVNDLQKFLKQERMQSVQHIEIERPAEHVCASGQKCFCNCTKRPDGRTSSLQENKKSCVCEPR
jgi:hypothetical protein